MLNTVQQINAALIPAKQILVVFKDSPARDGAAAACALADVLGSLGKQVEVVASNWRQGEELKFLPAARQINPQLSQSKKLIIKVDLSEAEFGGLSYDLQDSQLFIQVMPRGRPLTNKQVRTSPGRWPHDLVFVLDCPDLLSLGEIYHSHQDLFLKTPVVNIDHHPANENFGQINLVDLKAAAVCEVLYDLCQALWPDKITSDCATALLIGILGKTKSFRAPNISAPTLAKASELVKLGARREEIVQHLFSGRSVETLKLWGLALSKLKNEAGLVWLSVRAEDFLQSGAADTELLGLIEELLSQSPAAKIVTVLYESASSTSGHSINVLVHTHDHYDARILTRAFNSQGSKNMVRFNLTNQTLAAAESQVIGSLKNILSAVYPQTK